MRPGSLFGLTTLCLVSRTSLDDRLGEGPPWWQGEQHFHAALGYALFTAMAAACAALSLGAVAPYGRYANVAALGIKDWGPEVPAPLAWCLQELPSLLVPLVCLLRPGWGPVHATNGVLLLCFLAHYANRALVYPLKIRGGAPTPLYVMASAAAFTSVNGYLQMGALCGPWAEEVPGDAAFYSGVLLFAMGALGNVYHDALLRSLRAPGTKGYSIPRGGLFEFVSGANYLCEIAESARWRGGAPGSLVVFHRRNRRMGRVCHRVSDACGPNIRMLRRVQSRAQGRRAPLLVPSEVRRLPS